MNAQIDWFGEFLWAIYEVHSDGKYEIYLHTTTPDPDGICVGSSLYVPLRALLAKDWPAIVKRHTDYNTGYYRDRKNSEGKLFLPMALAALESPEALRLKEKLTCEES